VDETYSTLGEMMNACKSLAWRPQGKLPLWRCKRGLGNNIKMDFKEIGWGGMDWIPLAQDRAECEALVNTIINFWVP
jgi:hypothetical protein